MRRFPAVTAEEARTDAGSMLRLLDRWVEQGWLRALDRALAAFLCEQVPEPPPLLLLAAALTSHQLGRGHVCVDLEATLADVDATLSLPPEGGFGGDDRPPLPSECLEGVTMADWLGAMDHADLVSDGPGSTPLVRVGVRLYLRRYWDYEQRIRRAVEDRASRRELPPGSDQALRDGLHAFFPADGTDSGTDWQKVAGALAAQRAFTVITGGPGTGKTTTVVRLLALLQTLALGPEEREGPPLRIRLAAPTGKAAARLNESIAGAVRNLRLPGNDNGERLRGAIPAEATTVHRLLGSRPGTRHFRHNRRNPLPVDVLVVDEASMVDVEMMASLLDALPPAARLVLLGDKDQLASVEAGAVLGDLCRRAPEGHYTPDTRQWLEAVTGESIDPRYEDPLGTPLDQGIVMLRVSHRFSGDSGIGRLAERVNAGDIAGVDALWDQAGQWPDLHRLRLRGEEDPALADLVVDGVPVNAEGKGAPGYRHYLTVATREYPGDCATPEALDNWAASVLLAFSEVQLLCAVRSGPWGVEALNQRIARHLRDLDLISGGEQWYQGRPVLVTRNDYALGLMNGDVGITLAYPWRGADERIRRVLRVAFPAGDGSGRIKWLLPSRLNDLETVFAMTVHKSQGSEFAHTALVLPDRPVPVLTRELVYTGITRARRRFTLITAADGILAHAVGRRVHRVSGLFD